EPEASAFIQVAYVPHAMPERPAVLNLGERRRLPMLEILPCDDRALDHDLADLTGREDQPVVPGRNVNIRNADDPQGDAGKRRSDAGALACAGKRGGLT